MGFFQDLFTNDAAKDAAVKAAADREKGVSLATGTLTPAYGEAAKYLDTAQKRYDPMAETANKGFQAYGDLLGLTGKDPTEVLRNQPGYTFGQDQAAEMLKRNQASIGALASGDTWNKLMDTSRNRADQNWQQYANALQPFLQLSPSIAGAQGAYDTQKAGLTTGLADKIAGLQSGQWNANAESDANAELARMKAASNVFDAVMGVGKLAVSAFTGIPALGGSGLGGGMGGKPSPS